MNANDLPWLHARNERLAIDYIETALRLRHLRDALAPLEHQATRQLLAPSEQDRLRNLLTQEADLRFRMADLVQERRWIDKQVERHTLQLRLAKPSS